MPNQSTMRKEKKQIEIFNMEYDRYQLYYLDNWRVSYLKRLMRELALVDSADLFMDIGVGGSGYTVIEIARMGIFSVGIDISSVGIRKASLFSKKALSPALQNLAHFIIASAEYIPIKDNSFTKIACIAVLEHIPDDQRVIKEFSRIIKRRGKVFVTVPNSHRRMLPFFIGPSKIIDKRVGHLRHYNAEDLVKIFVCLGFRLDSFVYSGHIPKILQFLVSRLVPKMNTKSSKLWWTLESWDLRCHGLPTGYNLSLVFRKI